MTDETTVPVEDDDGHADLFESEGDVGKDEADDGS
jgi:hypothetical protein